MECETGDVWDFWGWGILGHRSLVWLLILTTRVRVSGRQPKFVGAERPFTIQLNTWFLIINLLAMVPVLV